MGSGVYGRDECCAKRLALFGAHALGLLHKVELSGLEEGRESLLGAAESVAKQGAFPRAKLNQGNTSRRAKREPHLQKPGAEELTGHLRDLRSGYEVAALADTFLGGVITQGGVRDGGAHVLGDGDGPAAERDNRLQVADELGVGGRALARLLRKAGAAGLEAVCVDGE